MPPEDNDLYISPKVGISISIALVLLGAGVGSLVAWYVTKTASTPAKIACSAAELDAKYQSGFAAAKKLVEESSIGGALRSAEDVRALSGTVAAISDTSLTLHTRPVNPFDDPALTDRTILISSSTRVIALVPKDPIVYQKELDSYTKAIRVGTTTFAAPPQSSTLVSSNLAAVKVGSAVTVGAVDNVKSAKEFSATVIQILTPNSPQYVKN